MVSSGGCEHPSNARFALCSHRVLGAELMLQRQKLRGLPTELLAEFRGQHGRAFFSGFPETTAPELISSSILGSRSDKPDQLDHTTTDFQNTLQTLGLTWFGGVSATSGVAFFTPTFLRSTC